MGCLGNYSTSTDLLRTQKLISSSTSLYDEQLLVRSISLQEFEQICHILLDDCLELLNGEIIVYPVPDTTHIQQAIQIETLLRQYYLPIHAIGGWIAGASAWYSLPGTTPSGWTDTREKRAHCVRPDASICYAKYWEKDRYPPAMVVAEVLSLSSQSEVDSDLLIKPDIYASLEIPAYWVIDRRDQSVWVHTAPCDGKYTKRVQYKGRKKLPAPGLEFLTITPAQIFAN